MQKTIKQLKEERGALHTQMHEIVVAAEQRGGNGEFTPEERTSHDAHRANYDAMSERIARLEGDERRAAEQAQPVPPSPAAPAAETRAEVRQEELRSAFLDIMSGTRGRNDVREELRAELFMGASNNQIVVPKLVMNKVTAALKSTGTFLEAVDFVITETSESYILPTYDARGDLLTRVKEGEKALDDAANKFGGAEIRAYDYNTGIQKIHIRLLQGAGVDVEAIVIEAITQCVRRGLNKLATISGTGVDDITALLSSAPVALTAANVGAITYDELIDVVASMESDHAKAWMMSNNTLLNIAKIKTTDGAPIFLRDVNTGAISHILGYPVIINEDMPRFGTAAAKPIAFGDMKLYHLRMVKGVKITIFHEKYAHENMIGIMGHVAADGKLNDAGSHPVKVLQLP